ncbi:hypothetical protein RAS1_43740 [Phycisphaerae bacterium RAS1]|nr:hypothetical protein RAS1_43740 [Phycisphaerae bacterium RAS1]
MVDWNGQGLPRGDPKMGRFYVDVDLANYDDVVRAMAGDIDDSVVRRATISALVDTGATRLVVPEPIATQLGLRIDGSIGVRYADGHAADRPLAQGVQLTFGGRSSVFNAIVEPQRDTALIGAIVLEDLDFVVDCTQQRLVPRDPRHIISEIE